MSSAAGMVTAFQAPGLPRAQDPQTATSVRLALKFSGLPIPYTGRYANLGRHPKQVVGGMAPAEGGVRKEIPHTFQTTKTQQLRQVYKTTKKK